jgi:hypothetical protein
MKGPAKIGDWEKAPEIDLKNQPGRMYYYNTIIYLLFPFTFIYLLTPQQAPAIRWPI